METDFDRLECPRGGELLLSSFPGLLARRVAPFDRRAAIEAGTAALSAAGATAMITLVETAMLDAFGVPDLGAVAARAGLAWLHLPIADFSTPDTAFLARWREEGRGIHARLDRGEAIAIHCRAGLGRTGTVAAMILVERSLQPREAIAAVREARPGTIETTEQQAWVRALRSASA
ncbi:dual specificity protein phosphatase family protein [Terrarubrum flagellatum]|uniref:phosphatase domain-containing putative toxin n=1 Tax=Terrirubrum flagellatum TaxID=2895980 RepID=UPI003145204D